MIGPPHHHHKILDHPTRSNDSYRTRGHVSSCTVGADVFARTDVFARSVTMSPHVECAANASVLCRIDFAHLRKGKGNGLRSRKKVEGNVLVMVLKQYISAQLEVEKNTDGQNDLSKCYSNTVISKASTSVIEARAALNTLS